jgi:peptidyl-prolyl cis-trans isomerase B (cyclophilin B)
MTRRTSLTAALLAVGCALTAWAQTAPSVPPAKAPASAEALEAVVETAAGEFVISLLPEIAPRHVRHFVKTARAGGYDRTLFHRLVPRAILQGGDPLSRDAKRASLHGTGGLGLLRSEFSSRPMTRGSVAAVLRPRDPHSGGSQFFICLFDQPSLTGKFTIFGEVKGGLDVVDRLADVEVVGERPAKPLVINRVTVRSAEAPAALPMPSPAPVGGSR